MPTNFPTSLDSHPAAATLAAHTLGTDPHSTLHGDLGLAVDALEAKVGADSSAVTTSLDYKVTNLITPPVGSALGTTGTINLDMATLNGTYQTIALSGNPTFTSSNRVAGRTVTLKLSAGGGTRTLVFPAWIFVGAAAPASLASGKVGVFTVTFFDTTDAAAVASYAAQP